jgi:hypothetical protein
VIESLAKHQAAETRAQNDNMRITGFHLETFGRMYDGTDSQPFNHVLVSSKSFMTYSRSAGCGGP